VERHGYAYGQPLSHPLAGATLKQIHDYPWPDPDWVDVSGLRAQASRYRGEYAILGGDWSPFWHDAIDLMGMEELMIAMYDEPERVDALLEYLVGYYLGSSNRIFEEAADLTDIFFIGNDFGSQTGPLLGEGLFRRFMFQHLKSFADLGHRYGLKVMLHCCGGFEPLIPAMIEAGIDALQSLQPSVAGMDPAVLKARYGDRMVFNGCIDSHHVLIDDDPEKVREKTREIVRIMQPGGGFICSASHDYILEETPVENVLAMFDTAKEG
jgi:uroporphyrinogen decarboxylase